ncbi:MAG: zinc ribbon domain-containing protein [Acidobacteriaceae bacterium]
MMMMFGFGWLVMLLVVGLPILLLVVLTIAAAGYLQNRNQNIPAGPYQVSNRQPMVSTTALVTPAGRYCPHCGAGLQSDWTHCPQCGAPIQ